MQGYRDRLFGLDLPIRIACVLALVISEDGPELADEVVAALDQVSNDRHDG